jgi:hypothetical protein
MAPPFDPLSTTLPQLTEKNHDRDMRKNLGVLLLELGDSLSQAVDLIKTTMSKQMTRRRCFIRHSAAAMSVSLIGIAGTQIPLQRNTRWVCSITA